MGEGSSKSAVEILRGLEEEESMGNDELSGLQLGLSLGRCKGGSNGGVDPAVGSVASEMRVGREIDRPELELAIGCSRYLERYASLNGGQEAVREFLVDFDRLSQEEEDLLLGLERAKCNRDFQHKRAKVQFHPE